MIDLADEKQRLALFYRIRGAAITVEKNLGPYMVEKYYEKALIMELKSLGLSVESQVAIPTFYKGEPLELDLFADLLIENELVVELKATHSMEKSHMRQLLTYMKLMRKHYGLIINFGISFISKYGMKAMVLSNFDDVVKTDSDFEDKIGLVAFS
ncbi:MAG: GxxExxY protein [Muribaculaceae bacterium]|nr:GxxExxY protein [Muribaculaceae bacterium]